jgi:hypothetical protein
MEQIADREHDESVHFYINYYLGRTSGLGTLLQEGKPIIFCAIILIGLVAWQQNPTHCYTG